MTSSADDLAARIKAKMPRVAEPALTQPTASEPPTRDPQTSFHIRMPASQLENLHRLAWSESTRQGRRISPQMLIQDLIAATFGDKS